MGPTWLPCYFSGSESQKDGVDGSRQRRENHDAIKRIGQGQQSPESDAKQMPLY